MPAAAPLTIFLVGDVMLGRGIDQISEHSCDPVLYEHWVKDAREYVNIAVARNGPFPRNRDIDYVWGNTLAEFKLFNPDVKIINLETAVTTNSSPWPLKGINYRMHPENVSIIKSAGIDVCVLGNNHVLDWCERGLEETLFSLRNANIKTAGAGYNLEEAASPAIVQIADKGRVLVLSIAHESSGVFPDWAAAKNKLGVNFVDHFDKSCVDTIKNCIQGIKLPSDIVVLSVHWGGNWGYDVPLEFQRFAKAVIDDACVDIVHGHSSHHPKAIQVYHSKLIFYGCGDFLNDYEGISSHLEYNPDLTFMYFVKVNTKTHAIIDVTLVPAKIKHFRIDVPSSDEISWLEEIMKRECKAFNTTLYRENDHLKINVNSELTES